MISTHHIAKGQGAGAADRQIAVWLLCLCALVFAMVLLGGYTRLTQSGLSMTDWRPVTGLLPPIGEAAWGAEFERYRQFPEFRDINAWMEVADFKRIFLIEYAHRMLGRLVGVAFLLPFLYFLAARKLTRWLVPRLALMFVLGAAQGVMGWYMVMSGLADEPDVSHYRLTAHLGFAVAIFGYILWLAMGLLGGARGRGDRGDRGMRRLAAIIGALLFVQILSGGLVAGLDAGHGYNTWPLIDGAIVPAGLLALDPWAINPFENVLTVQFDHRMMAYLIVVLSALLWWRGRSRALGAGARFAVTVVAVAIALQAALGVLTLVGEVPLVLALAHQGGALLAFAAALYATFQFTEREGEP